MHRSAKLFIAAAALAVGAFALAAQDAVNLRVTPAKGTVVKYKATGTIQLMGTEVDVILNQTETILESGDSGYVSEAATTGGSANLGGQEIPIPETPSLKNHYGKDGVIQKIEGEDASSDQYRFAHLSTIFRPEGAKNVGDSWTWELPASSTKGTPAVKTEYKLLEIVEMAGERAAVIQMTSKETEGAQVGSMTGKVHLGLTSGMMLRLEVNFTNLPLPGAPEPVSGKLTVVKEN